MKASIKKYLAGKASKSESEFIRIWLQTDQDVNNWINQEIESSPSEMNPEICSRVYRNITQKALLSVNSGEKNPCGPQRTKWMKPFFVWTAACIAIIFFTWNFFMMKESIMPKYSFSVETSVGEHPTITLADGTVVRMNSLTHLDYSYDEDTQVRHVNLNGEAYFIVKHNEESPFIVKTSNLDVRCLGTEFNVRAYSTDQFESVVLTEGKVSVNTLHTEEILKPNTMLAYDKEKAIVSKKRVYTDNYTAWTENLFFFDNAPLKDIVNALYRSMGIIIKYDEKELADTRFVGTIGGKDYHSAIEILSKAIDAKYTIANDSTVYLHK